MGAMKNNSKIAIYYLVCLIHLAIKSYAKNILIESCTKEIFVHCFETVYFHCTKKMKFYFTLTNIQMEISI